MGHPRKPTLQQHVEARRLPIEGATFAELAPVATSAWRESRTLRTARILGSAKFDYVYILGEKLRKPGPKALA
jgi:hypothetical protein